MFLQNNDRNIIRQQISKIKIVCVRIVLACNFISQLISEHSMYLLCQVMMDQLHASLERQPSQGGLACDKKLQKHCQVVQSRDKEVRNFAPMKQDYLPDSPMQWCGMQNTTLPINNSSLFDKISVVNKYIMEFWMSKSC